MSQSILEESKKAKRGFFRFLFNKKFLIFASLIIITSGAVYYFYYYKNTQNMAVPVQFKKYTVNKEDIKISVQSTGKVVAKDGVELSFPVSGNLEVNNVYVKEGDKIKKGDKIASVKTENLEFELRNAYAGYQSSLANFNSKKTPSTDSEIKKAKTAIDQAQVSLDQAKISLDQTKSNSAQNIDNAKSSLKTAENNLRLNNNDQDSELVLNAYTSLLNNLKSINITIQRALHDSDSIIGVEDTMVNLDFKSALGVRDASTMNAARNSYPVVKNANTKLGLDLALLSSVNNSGIDNAASEASQTLTALQSHLSDVQSLLDASVIVYNLSQSKLDGFKSTISSDRSNANSLVSGFDNAKQAVSNAKNSLDQYQISYNKAASDVKAANNQAIQNLNNATISVKSREIALVQAKNDYADLIAPVKESDLASARAQLTSAAISVDKAKYNMEQATLISPIDGVVSMFNYKKGDIILDSSTNSKTVATIINNDTLFIEANIEEADISKLKVGEKAQVSFDAVDGVNLTGEISFISLTSTTNSNGIVTYLVRVLLTNKNKDQIREGMTATIEFITSEATNVLSIPVAAVRNIAGSPSVEMADGTITKVTTGFTDGKKVEIISGLKDGDVIVY